MPRIRTIKPDFWTDGDVIGLSLVARLFFIGTWNFALCDKGHLPDDPVKLKLQILPADDVDASEVVEEVIGAGRIVRITAGERTFLHIKRFEDHQKVDARWNSRCPACAYLDSTALPETPRDSPEFAQTRSRKGKERKGKERNTSRAETRGDSGEFEQFWSAYPRRIDKGHAVKAWATALKKADAETIILAAKRFAGAVNGTDPKFIPHPATWLNGERWGDELARPIEPDQPYAPDVLEDAPPGMSPEEYAAWERGARERQRQAR